MNRNYAFSRVTLSRGRTQLRRGDVGRVRRAINLQMRVISVERVSRGRSRRERWRVESCDGSVVKKIPGRD